MKFRCNKCNTQYTIADEKVRGKIIKIRCKRCKNLIVIRSSDAAACADASSPVKGARPNAGMEQELDQAFKSMAGSNLQPPVSGASEEKLPVLKDEWYFGLDGSEQGPYTFVQMKEMAASGQLSYEHFVWREGMKDWLPIEDVPDLFQLLSPSGQIAPPPPPPRARKKQARPPELRRAKEKKKTEVASKPLSVDAPGQKQDKEEFDEKTPATFLPLEQLRKGSVRASRVSFRGKVRKDEHSRMDLIERVYHKREKVRADRTADRIAEHFFVPENADIPGEDAPLPSPPVGDVDALARQLHEESIKEERVQLQHDPIAVLVKRDQPGKSQQSKVTKMMAAQAGVGAAGKSRRLLITLLSVVGILGLVGAGGYLAYSQGWFAGKGFGRLADSVESEKLGPDDIVLPENFSNLSPEERRRLREALWEEQQKQQKTNGRKHVRRPYLDMGDGPKFSKRGLELKRFYEKQSETKEEVMPRGPDGALISMTPVGIDMPATSIDQALLPEPGSKIEVAPQAPAACPQRLTDLQIRQVIRKNFRQVHSCHQRQLKRDSRVAGKMYVVARVKPDGRVARVHIKTAKFHGTFVEECLTKKIKRWEFPSFKGEAYDVTFPLLLTTQGGS